jgi:hypothetical protein
LEWLLAKETPNGYAARRDFVYEVVLKTAGGSPWLKNPENAHRTLQALLLLQKMLEVEWLDILMWQDGIYLRLKLGGALNLLEVLNMLRERSTPAGGSGEPRWEDEPTWVRMVTPERSKESNRLLWQKLETLMGSLRRMPEDTASLFFFHQGN